MWRTEAGLPKAEWYGQTKRLCLLLVPLYLCCTERLIQFITKFYSPFLIFLFFFFLKQKKGIIGNELTLFKESGVNLKLWGWELIGEDCKQCATSTLLGGWMISVFLVSWKCRLQKEESPKLRLLFLSLFFLLSNLSPSLTSEEVRRSSPTLCPVYFHMGLKSASSQIRIDSFVLFCKLKISHSFDTDRNRCPLQSVELEQASLLLLLFFFSFFSSSFSPRSWRKRPEKSIKSMNDFHQRHVHLRERRRDGGKFLE